MDNILMILEFMIRLSIVWLPITLSIILYSVYETYISIVIKKSKTTHNKKYIKRVTFN